MNKHRLRMSLLGVLCGGMMLLGVGIGIGTLEFSGFSYGGTVIPGQREGVIQEIFQLSPEGEDKLYLQNYREKPENTKIIPDANIERGTVQIEGKYRSMPDTEYWINVNQSEDGNLYCSFYGSSWGMASLMVVKDQLFQDLRNRCIHSYLSGEMEEINVYVHPADQDRIVLNGGFSHPKSGIDFTGSGLTTECSPLETVEMEESTDPVVEIEGE